MVRRGGNPDLVKFQYQRKEGASISRNKPWSIAVEAAILPMLKASNKEMMRRAIVECLVRQGFEVDPRILSLYNIED